MILFITKAFLHNCASHFTADGARPAFLFPDFSFIPFGYKCGGYFIFNAIFSVGISCINSIRPDLMTCIKTMFVAGKSYFTA
jgi:hypothetical protein